MLFIEALAGGGSEWLPWMACFTLDEAREEKERVQAKNPSAILRIVRETSMNVTEVLT